MEFEASAILSTRSGELLPSPSVYARWSAPRQMCCQRTRPHSGRGRSWSVCTKSSSGCCSPPSC